MSGAATTLGISTSGSALSLALFEGAALIAHDHRLIGRGHAEALVPAIAALMGDRRADAITVDTGPGSYTGIRIGIAAARALGVAWGVPVTGCPAALLVSGLPRDGDGEAEVWLDAGRGMVFGQAVTAAGLAGPLALLPGAGVTPQLPDMANLMQVPLAARSGPPAAIYAPVTDAARPW